MDPTYIRPLPTKEMKRMIFLQELGCFLFLATCAIIPPVFLNRWPIPFLIQAYSTGVVLVFLNALRTLAAHRWQSGGEEGSFTDQMLDSITMDNDSLPAILINPVGLRYHATHHLFPSMPYHNMRAAHKRLMAELPADSPYRQTVGRSIWAQVVDLWRRAAAHPSTPSQRQAGSPSRQLESAA
jgi:fatty acid desaturase